jgi:WD40 repeat protein
MRMHRTVLEAILVLLLLSVAAPMGEDMAAAAATDPSGMGLAWQNLTGHDATLWSVRWSPDGSKLSATCFDNSTSVYNSTTGELLARIEARPVPAGRCDGYTPPGCFPLRCSAWSPDGSYLAMGGDDRAVLLYNVSDWTLARVLTGHRGSVLTLDFSPDGRYLASGSGTDKVEMNNANDENLVKVWDVENSTLVKDLAGHQDGVMEARWSPDGRRLVSCSDDKTIRVWETSNWSLEAELRGHTLGVLCADFSPDGGTLVTGSRDYTIRLWDLDMANFSRGAKTSIAQMAKWSAPNCVRSVDWHPGGEWIAASGVDTTLLTVRNATTGAVIRTFTESAAARASVMSARWSPDGGALAAGSGKEAAVRVYVFGERSAAASETVPWWVPNMVIYSIISWAGFIVFWVLARRHMEGERR